MKKRLLAMLLALSLVLSLVPSVVVAEGDEHVHCLCGTTKSKGEVCAECGSKAEEWTATSTMPTTSGYYYLTGPVSAGAQFLNNNENISLCLHGQTVTSAAGKKFLYLNKNNVYNITDCTANGEGDAYTAGSFTGATGVDTYGSTMRVNAGCTLNLYDGIITGNKATDSGVIYVDGSNNASVAAGTFNMYGGRISDNTCLRGTVYGVSTGTNKPVIRILGGTITGNHANGTGSQAGGGGICAFSPVEVGGNAKIFGNTASLGPEDIYLRNDGTFTGSLVISSAVPLQAGAQIQYGLHVDEADITNLKAISGSADANTWQSDWVFYDDQKVGYNGSKFFVDTAVAGHIHCLCGAQTTKGSTCDACGSVAVEWIASGTIPGASGYYYLTGNVSTTPVTPAANTDIAICLHGCNVTSAAGRKIFYLSKGASLTIADCSKTAGKITGTTTDCVIQVDTGASLSLYGGKIADNTNTGNGIVLLGKGNSTTSGGAFYMYGGQICDNTSKRGTVMMTNATGTEKPAIVRILGGSITGNHATGTSNVDGGGAGVLAMSPMEVGGNAKIYGNTAAAGPADVYLRNDQKGALVLSSEKPLTGDAKIAVGLYTEEADVSDLQTISGTPDADSWNTQWISYEGQDVGYDGTRFYVGTPKLPHIHCLCGQQTEEGSLCANCGSTAVQWQETSVMPAASGYYYLTGPVSANAQFLNNGEKISLCLHGQTVTSATGKRFLYLNKNNTYNITDCTASGEGDAYTAGSFTGATGVDTYGSTMRVNAGCTLNLYDGIITGNAAQDSGVVYVDKSDNADVPAGIFNMYGGKISGNTCQRGTVYGVSGGANKPVIRILGGTITGNRALGTGSQVGGGGIFAFSPVEVGGNAGIYGNTAAAGAADIYLRNDGDFTGALVISAQIALFGDAKISYGLQVTEKDWLDLQFISGTPDAATWDVNWVSYDGQKVDYDGEKFFVDKASVQGHIHCLCGAETTFSEVCASCGGEAVLWNAVNTIPATEGYYYLTADVTTTPMVPSENTDIRICLHGHNITSAAGKKLAYVSKGAVLTVTDCAEVPGMLTGCENESVVQVAMNSAFCLYGGLISGNTTTGDGVVLLEKGNTTTPGGAFYMYGGEISGNTVRRGTITMTNAPGEDQSAVVRILGGSITGNHATGANLVEGGGAGVLAMGPVEIGGDAKIYGNTSAAGPADIYIRNDQKGKLIISSEKPLTDGAKINCGLYTSETNLADLQYVTGAPVYWEVTWVSYCGEALRYEDGKFTIAKPIVWSDHQHDNVQWISVTEQTGLLPESTGYYVLDGDLQLQAELKILPQQKVVLCLNGHDLIAAPGVRHFYVAAGGSLTICDCTAVTAEDGTYTAGKITGADGKVGGGAIRMAPGSVVNLYGGKITGNHTTGEGGAFYLEACSLSNPAPAVLNMYGGEISENTADKGYGAAIRFAGAPEGLQAATFHMEGGFIRNHKSPNYGGAIHAPGKATIELMGGVIENNEAVAGGGGVSVNGASTLIVDGTVIRNNSAQKWGGGVYIKTGATMEMRSGEVSGNSSKIGAGILLESKDTNLTITGGKITKNAAGTAGGGGVYVGIGCAMTMSGGEICENTSKAGGAGLSCTGGTVTMEGGNICHNKADSWGAGALVSTDAVFTMNGGSINDNYTPKSAAGIYAWCAKIVISDGAIKNNVAQDVVGGIRLVGSTLTMSGGSITGNLGNTGSGAGVMGEQGSRTIDGVKRSIPSHIVMTGGSISYNKAAKAGSGVIIQSKGSTFNMYGGTISHNHAGKFAGAVYVGVGAAFNMHGGDICYNTMDTDGAAGVYHAGGGNHTGGSIHHNTTPKSGAGIAVSGKGAVVYAKNMKIYENAAKVAGGVLVQSSGVLHMENCEIYDNTATMYGAGVYMYTYTNITMKDCKIYGNESQVDGGGVWMWATAQIEMDGCEIYENTAVEGEGGAFWTRGDVVTLRNCVIRDNTAAGNGGGIFAGMMGSATLGYVDYITTENTLMQNNRSGKQGGAIYLSAGSKAKLCDTQLVDNKAAAEGGALWAVEDLTMRSVTVTGNTSGGEGYAVYLQDSGYDGHSYFAGQIKMSGDMKIVDNKGGDLYLGEKVPVLFDGDGLGQNAKIHVNMHSGLLTQWVWGSYNYEGGNCDYIITYGDRSVREPEYAEVAEQMPETEPGTEATEAPTQGEQEVPKSNMGLMAGIASVVVVIAAAAVVIVLVSKKKKTAK